MNISVCLLQKMSFERFRYVTSNISCLRSGYIDVKAAHKRVVIKESHHGLLGFSHRNAIYFYKVAPFGAIFSAHWWGRLGSFWVRFLHQAIFVHALFLFGDYFMLLQRKDVLPLTAAFVCSLMQVFGLPISWQKADLHCAIDWIGWRFNFNIGVVYLQERKGSKLLDLISQMLSHSRIPKKSLENILSLALWITQIFPQMRSSLHYLFPDLHRPPSTQYSMDPGYWPTPLSCLSDTLHFSSRPADTAIPAGSKLISIRHQPVNTLEDVQRTFDRKTYLDSGFGPYIVSSQHITGQQTDPSDVSTLVATFTTFSVLVSTGKLVR